jgi:hypothetical protein
MRQLIACPEIIARSFCDGKTGVFNCEREDVTALDSGRVHGLVGSKAEFYVISLFFLL